jgi:signal transduction protein with GAF and PtsI domain
MAPDEDLEDKLSEQLNQLIDSIEAGGRTILPDSNEALLKSIVEAAGRIFNAKAASLLLVIEQEQVLEFKVSYGSANSQDLVGMRFPMTQGIAGYVVMTGQPIAVSNVRQDPRFNRDFAQSTGYVPSSILATPLFFGDRIIGVMEVLDKINAESFGMQDMDLLGMFANQAAIAINQSQQIDNVKETMILGLKKLANSRNGGTEDELGKILDEIGTNKPVQDMLEIAELFRDISGLGAAERKVCLQVLKTFAEYRQSIRRNRYER